MPCTLSENLICKHPRSVLTFYADLSFLPVGVTAVSATADTEDASLAIDAITVLDEDIVVDPYENCDGVQLQSGRALLIVLSGGIPSDDEVIVTVNWVQSDGDEDSRDCRVLVEGSVAAE